MNVADIQISEANQFILACELEDLIGLEHPNSLAGRGIKGEEIRSRTVAIFSDPLPGTVELRRRVVACTQPPVGGETGRPAPRQ